MKNQEALEAKINQLQKEVEIMRQIRTPKGFYDYWFSKLPKFKTRLECFNYVNDLHYDYFGEYKYSHYNSFTDANRNRKKSRK